MSARLAQSVERETLNLKAAGSSPALGSFFFFFFFHRRHPPPLPPPLPPPVSVGLTFLPRLYLKSFPAKLRIIFLSLCSRLDNISAMAFIRPQRVLQRLTSSSRSTASSRAHLTTSPIKTTTTAASCAPCQNQARPSSNSAVVNQPRFLSHRRTFTTTLRTLNSNTTSEEEPTLPNAPNTSTYYTIFPSTLPSGPPPHASFSIDTATLRREFLQLQNTLHPDKYPPGPQKKQAETLSATINEAYRTLLDPLLRAQYILRTFHDIDVTAEDGAGSHPLDQELLMEVMDVQEAIEEVGQGPEAEKEIEEMKRENDERVKGCLESLAAAFDSGDIEGATGEAVRLKFWAGVGAGLKEWEPGMGGIKLVH
ncbi:HSCB C-terminal oligomerization domain-containing protein [Aspergillus venezuelensis]